MDRKATFDLDRHDAMLLVDRKLQRFLGRHSAVPSHESSPKEMFAFLLKLREELNQIIDLAERVPM